ncbi:MAG: helix-turn-helix domain-containing protein [Mycobacterium sp.]
MSMLPGVAAATIAANVRAEAARRNIAQSTIAKGLGLTQSATSRRLLGYVPFSATELAAVSEILDMPIESLFGENSSVAAASPRRRPKRPDPV